MYGLFLKTKISRQFRVACFWRRIDNDLVKFSEENKNICLLFYLIYGCANFYVHSCKEYCYVCIEMILN